MKYPKPALSFEQQAQLLINRGLIVENKEILIRHLQMVNYYRLSAYWYPFKKIDPITGQEEFKANTTFETIWNFYSFDRHLRLLIMDAIEKVEVAFLRTRMVEQFSLLHGPFGYTEIKNFSPKFTPENHQRLLDDVNELVSRSKEEFVSRFQTKYYSESKLPLWIVVEIMSFGNLFTFYRYLNRFEQQRLSKLFNLYPPVLESWLHTLNFIRNACAHHSRLWNRVLPIRPQLPDERHNPEWYSQGKIDNRYIFSVLTLLRYLLRFIDTESDWQSKLENLLDEYPNIPVNWMGFPAKWKEIEIWK
ncbi:MAG: Abi family protein [Anaerolineales bacterium]|nr:Abi family protein [Anaerolineales bacterium]